MNRNMNPRKRQRQPATVDAEAVAIYEDLAHESEDIRLKAAKALLLRLGPESVDSEALRKAFRRLFRGLCSSRKAARLGFSVALTELLAQHVREDLPPGANNLLVEHILDDLEAQSRINGNISGQEERDHYLGRLFGAEAVIKSGILALPNNTDNHWERLLELIFDLAQRKVWLREECGWVLYGALKGGSPLPEDHAKTLINMLHLNGLAKTPEGVALWLVVQSNYPGIQLPKHVWHHGNPLHRKEKVSLARVLRETTPKDDTKDSVQRGNWVPKLHFAWEVVFEALPMTRSEKTNFADLWAEVVDNGLFASASSDERKFWGFLLIQRYLMKLPGEVLPAILAPNTLRCLTNQLISQSRNLHRAAEKTLKTLHERVEKEPVVAIVVIEKLFQLGYANFDSLTKRKTIEKLIAQAGHSNIGEITKLCRGIILLPQTQDPKTAAGIRQMVVDYLVSATKTILTAVDHLEVDSHIFDVPKLLSVLAFSCSDTLNEAKGPIPLLATATRELVKSRLMSLVGQLMTKSNDSSEYPFKVLNHINKLIDSPGRTPVLLPFEKGSEISTTVLEANKTLQNIHNEATSADSRQKEQLIAFKLLYSLTILQVYNGDTDAVSILDELSVCYEKLYAPEGEERGGWEILVEIVLSLVSKQSVMFKRLAHQVFSACTSSINANGLESLVNVLGTRETLSGQQDVFEDVDEQHAEGDDSSEEASDVEMIDGTNGTTGHNLPTDDTSSVSSDSDNSSSDADNNSDPELAEFNAKLAQALGTKPLDQNLSADVDESSDEDMNDEQMEALDAQLETVFKERKKAKVTKNERKEAKETVVLFKSRVLELLEIYIKQEYLNPLALEIIFPLIRLIRTTSSKQVSEKASTILREYSRLYKMKDKLSRDPVAPDYIKGLLEGIHAAAMLEGSNAYGTACSQASLLVSKILIANGHDPEEVVAQYAETQKKFLLDSNCHVRTAFFSDWLNWCTSARKNLAAVRGGKANEA